MTVDYLSTYSGDTKRFASLPPSFPIIYWMVSHKWYSGGGGINSVPFVIIKLYLPNLNFR